MFPKYLATTKRVAFKLKVMRDNVERIVTLRTE